MKILLDLIMVQNDCEDDEGKVAMKFQDDKDPVGFNYGRRTVKIMKAQQDKIKRRRSGQPNESLEEEEEKIKKTKGKSFQALNIEYTTIFSILFLYFFSVFLL